jgi:hypothetical protein
MTIDIAPALRALGVCALIGALTTLLNTVLPNFYSASDFDGRMALIHNPLYAARQWVLLVHPAFTLLLALGLAMALFVRAPGRAASGLMFAGVEKMTEFVLGTLILFVVNAEWKSGYLAAADAAAAAGLRGQIELFNELLGGTFYLLWAMFILSTSLFCSALDRTRPLERWLYWSGVATVAITAIMLIGSLAGLERWSDPIVTWTYPPLMTVHRTLAGLWLLSLSARGSARRNLSTS